jgi:putative membrane protein
MTWWCSATGQTWSWAWRAYPGVWLFVAALGLLLYSSRRPAEPSSRPTVWLAVAGILSVWLALDWPIGTLGAGYLASVHALSYILLSLIAPPLLIRAVPLQVLRRAAARPWVGPVLRAAARPMVALCVYSVALLVTHVPDVVDGGMRTQVGALSIDLAWLVAGLWLWWPVLAPQPEFGTLSRPLKMLYLFLSSLPPIIPSAFLTFADYPLYAVYELAPRALPILDAQQDQQVAGLLMKIVGDLPVWLAFGIIFFRWSRDEHRQAPAPRHPSVA